MIEERVCGVPGSHEGLVEMQNMVQLIGCRLRGAELGFTFGTNTQGMRSKDHTWNCRSLEAQLLHYLTSSSMNKGKES